jgi:hypothetical protein
MPTMIPITLHLSPEDVRAIARVIKAHHAGIAPTAEDALAVDNATRLVVNQAFLKGQQDLDTLSAISIDRAAWNHQRRTKLPPSRRSI